MANQNWLQKHACWKLYLCNKPKWNRIHWTVFLTEKIYEKKRPNFGKFNIQNVFLWQKTERSPKLRFIKHNKCTEVILPGFSSPSLSHNWAISARSNALKPNKSIHQHVTMATAERIGILLCMVWVNIFAYDHNLPQDQIGEKKLFRVSFLIKYNTNPCICLTSRYSAIRFKVFEHVQNSIFPIVL